MDQAAVRTSRKEETPLHYKTIQQVAELIRKEQLSPVELTETSLQRIGELDGRLKSYATVMADHALAAAAAAEREIASGSWRGPLHGVPLAVKDLCFTRGVRTMGGTKVLARHVPDFDATVVTRLAAAGAVVLGKLNLSEGAMGGYHSAFDIPLNPWNSSRWTGTSSSGSGVATAAGLCFGSLGSDTGGSIRYPSACCGLAGLKPTWGRVSRHGVLALAESLDHVGPMTRSTADAGLVLQAIAGTDPNDPTSLPDPVPDMLADVDKGMAGLRMGYDARFATDGIDPEISVAVLQAIEVLEELGAELVEVQLPDMDQYSPAWPVLCSAEASAAHEETFPSRRGEYGPWFRDWLDMGSKVTGAQYARADKLRSECTGHLRRVFAQVDLLVSPTMAALPHAVTPEELYGPMPRDRDPRLQRFTAPFNFSGGPTLSVPCGMHSEGLPLSLQIAARHLAEPLLCRVGHAFEQASDWHRMHPPI